MRNSLTWLHISDIHFNPKTEWRDSVARGGLIEYLKEAFKRDPSLRPDLVFCTGDIAFGETGSSPLGDQYKQAEAFFNSLLTCCGRGGVPLDKKRLFVVPGNHDVNRESINSDAQATLTTWAKDPKDHVAAINRRFEDRPKEFKDALKRLNEYAQFVQSYLPHQHDSNGRHSYAAVVDIEGLKVGIAGFNSSWSVAGPEDDRTLWLAAQWQFNSAQLRIEAADVRIGLIHHPVDWLNEADRDVATHRISNQFHFWLHGHSHNAWVIPAPSHITIAAGAVGAEVKEEFGINLVRLDLAGSSGAAHLHSYSPRDNGWLIAPVAKHAPAGQWSFALPSALGGAFRRQGSGASQPAAAPVPSPDKRTPELFGRKDLIRDAAAKLQRHPFLLVYGLRGNGKTSLIRALGNIPPLAGKEHASFPVTPATTATELFRQFATLLGETAELPDAPSGDIKAIAAEVLRCYPKRKPAWVWIDRAHHLLDSRGFRRPEIRNLLLGLQAALGTEWHWVLELRERLPAGLLAGVSAECEVPGLNKDSLADCLAHGAPLGREADWRYSGDNLKRIYQWLGGGHGAQAHPLAIQLLIEVARGRNETPLEALERHRSDFARKIEDVLLGDLYGNVLSAGEQRLIKALALYRSAIPHDHAEALEAHLFVPGAWDGVDRRCLLAPNADHSLYFLHSFIAGWLRAGMGYAGGEDEDADFTDTASEAARQARELHSAVAGCWLKQLGGSRRLTNLNISRALEAFHHLVAAGEADRVEDIAVELLSGNLEWARRRIERLYTDLFESKAPIAQLRSALQYAAILDPDNPKVQRFLGECWAKEEGRASSKALNCFERACSLSPTFPPYLANLGRTLLAQGEKGAGSFVDHLEIVKRDYPQAINDHVQAIESACLEVIGKVEQAALLRMKIIYAGSQNAVFYADEAKARLAVNDAEGALKILTMAEQNGCANDFILAIRATALQQSGRADQAEALRMKGIRAGSRNVAFYSDEAKARLDAGNAEEALEILALAEQNGCANDFILAIRATALQQSGRADQAEALRMERIRAGSRHAAFYTDEAKARLDAGNAKGALEILALAKQNGCADDFTAAMRAAVLRKMESHE